MSESYSELTPMMSQYLQIKRDNPEAILFFRLGDFYEMFFEDAKIASGILGLTLTGRDAGKGNRVPMCGIPYHAAENYLGRLLQHNLKVAICEQVEDPKAGKGIVRREIVRIVTPATVLGQASLLQPQNNYLAGVCQASPERFGFARLDVSTGEFCVSEFSGVDRVLSELTRVLPSEVLLCPQLRKQASFRAQLQQRVPAAVSEPEPWTFEPAAAYETLTRHFQTASLRGFGCEELTAGIAAAGAALRYVQDTQKNELVHIRSLRVASTAEFMILDSIAQRNLELTRTMRGEKKGSLIHELDYTRTAMGSRLLVQWVQQPLLDAAGITRRLDGVEELYGQQRLRQHLQESLKQMVDIERLLGRLSLNVANARDVYSLNQALRLLPEFQNLLRDCRCEVLQQVCRELNPLPELTAELSRAIRPDAPLSVREGRMILPGYDAQLDELLSITDGGKEWLAKLQEQEAARTGISSLKIKYNRVFGYYIEITNANKHLVPPDYIRKQTLVNAERFVTPQLKEQEEKILTAEERLVDREYQLLQHLRGRVLAGSAQIQHNATLIAVLDALNSLAEAADRNRYARPQISEGCELEIVDGRHPVVENLLPAGKFIANDTILEPVDNQLAIITGPNMAGKSTYIRQVAVIVLMAQMGSFVPARSANVGIVDRIFTRIGASDDITMGMSTFMMEMSETANILHNASERSLIILDEIGRGTSTFDGLSIAWAVAEYLQRPDGPRPKTLFATHYHELAQLKLTGTGVQNYNISVREWQDEVLFLYKLVAGSADHSYGIHVARLAGLPREVIRRSREILSNLEINSVSAEGIPGLVKSEPASPRREEQPDLFHRNVHPVVAQLRNLDIGHLTPLQALTLLAKWKEEQE